MSKVTVIIPAYNCTETLRDTLDSISSQTYKDFDIVVVNDGSTTETKDSQPMCDIIEKWIESSEDSFDGEFILLSKPNGGAGSARNYGIRSNFSNVEESEYIAVIDSDDMMLPNHLELMVKALDEADDVVGCVYSAYMQQNDNDGNSTYTGREPFCIERMVEECVPTSACMFKRKYYDAVGGYDEDYRLIEDYAFHAKMCLVCGYIYIDKPTWIYRIHKNNKTTTSVTKKKPWYIEHSRVKSRMQKSLGIYVPPLLSNSMAGGIGDLVAISATYKFIKECSPDSEIIHYCYDGVFGDVMEHNPYIDKLHTGGNLIDMIRDSAATYPRHQQMTTDYYYRYGENFWKTNLHLIQYFCSDICGVEIDIDQLQPEFYFDPSGADFIKPEKLLAKIGTDYIIVEGQTRSNKAGKEWPHFRAIYERLNDLGRPIISLASKDIRPIEGLSNVISIRDFSIRESAALIRDCSFAITLQSGLSFCADCFKKSGLMFNIGSPSSYAGRQFGDFVMIDQEKPFSPDTISKEEGLEALELTIERYK